MNIPKIKFISNVCVLLLQSTTLYTTFDEILDDSLPDQQDNRLIEVLGEPLMVRYCILLFLSSLSESLMYIQYDNDPSFGHLGSVLYLHTDTYTCMRMYIDCS